MTITYTTGPNGLTFHADQESRIELAGFADNYQKQLSLVLDDVTGDGLELLGDDDLAAIGALTNSEVFAEDVERDEDGVKLLDISDAYWFPNYQIQNPWDTLAATGAVTFTKTED